MRFSFLTLALAALFAESAGALDPSDLARNAGEYKTKVKQSSNADLAKQIYNAAKSEPKSLPTTKQFGIGIGGEQTKEKEATFSPTDEYTYSFDPSVEDPNWPGVFPTDSGVDLMVNVQTDNFTSEIFVNVEFAFTTNSTDSTSSATATTKSSKKGIPTPKQAGQSILASVPIDNADATEALYRVEVLDLGGKGNIGLHQIFFVMHQSSHYHYLLVFISLQATVSICGCGFYHFLVAYVVFKSSYSQINCFSLFIFRHFYKWRWMGDHY
mgnify:CR=1 FL=1